MQIIDAYYSARIGPWALPWALGPGPSPGPSPGPWWGPAGIGPCGALPWALVGPCGDRALRGPGPWWGPAGIGPCRGPNKYVKTHIFNI